MKKAIHPLQLVKDWSPLWGFSILLSFSSPVLANSTWKQIDEESMRTLESSLRDIQDQNILYNAKKRLADFYANKSKFSESEGLAQKHFRRQAIRYYSEALNLSQKDEAEIRLQKAALLNEDKKISEALGELNAIIQSEKSPQSLRMRALKLRAYAWVSQFQWEKADADFSRLDKTGRDELDEKDDHQWAWVKIYLKKESDALKLWQRATEKAEKKGLLAKEIYLDKLLFQWRSGRWSAQQMLSQLNEAPQAIRSDLIWALAEEAMRLGQKKSSQTFYQFFLESSDPKDSRRALADFRSKPLHAAGVRRALESLQTCSKEDAYCRELKKEVKNRILDEHRLVKTHPHKGILDLYLSYLDFVSDLEMLEVASSIAAYLDEEAIYLSLVTKLLESAELNDNKKEQILSDYLAHIQQSNNKTAKIEGYQFYLKYAKPSKQKSVILFDLTQLYHAEKRDRELLATSEVLLQAENDQALSSEQRVQLWDMRLDARYRLDDLGGFEKDLKEVAKRLPQYQAKGQERFERFLLEKTAKSGGKAESSHAANWDDDLTQKLKVVAQSSSSLTRRQKAHLLVWLQLKKNQQVDQEILWLQGALAQKSFLEESQKTAYVQRLYLLYWMAEDFSAAWRLAKVYERELRLPLDQKAPLADAAGDQPSAISLYRNLIESSQVSSSYRLFAIQRLLSLSPLNFDAEKKLFLTQSKKLSAKDQDDLATLLLLRNAKHNTWLKKHLKPSSQAALVAKRGQALELIERNSGKCSLTKSLKIQGLLNAVKSSKKELNQLQAEGFEVAWFKRAQSFEQCLTLAIRGMSQTQPELAQELLSVQNELLGQLRQQMEFKKNLLVQRWKLELDSLRPEFISLVQAEIQTAGIPEGQDLLRDYLQRKKEFERYQRSKSSLASSVAFEKRIELETQFGNPARANLIKQLSAQVNKEI